MSYFNLKIPFGFRMYYPKSNSDLHACFTMLESSAYYDHSMTRETTIRVWRQLLNEGIGYISFLEFTNPKIINDVAELMNPAGNPRKPQRGIYPYPSFPIIHFSVFITEKYAKEIVQNSSVKSVIMDFFKRYHNHQTNKNEVNPAQTKDRIESGAEGGLYCLSTLVLHKGLSSPLNSIPKTVRDKYSQFNRAQSKLIFGGFPYNAVFNDLATDLVKDGMLNNGHILLREYAGNSENTPERNLYVTCKTNNQETSNRLGLDQNIAYHTQESEWLGEMFNYPEPKANLSRTQKIVGYLLTLDYGTFDIMRHLDPTIDYENLSKKTKESLNQRLQSHITEIGRKFVESGYIAEKPDEYQKPEKDFKRFRIKEAILMNQHEIRPLILPLYQIPEKD